MVQAESSLADSAHGPLYMELESVIRVVNMDSRLQTNRGQTTTYSFSSTSSPSVVIDNTLGSNCTNTTLWMRGLGKQPALVCDLFPLYNSNEAGTYLWFIIIGLVFRVTLQPSSLV